MDKWLLIDAETHEVRSGPHDDEPEAEGAYATRVMLGYPDAWTWSAEKQGFVETAPRAPTITPLAFQRLFTQVERIAIRRTEDPIVQDFMALSAIALDIDLADADVRGGVQYLEAVGLIAEGRAAAILA